MGAVDLPDLNESRLPLLKLFQADRWEVTPEEHRLLQPSIQLASNLVRAAMPYIASFLPSEQGMFIDGNLVDGKGRRELLCPPNVPLKQDPSKAEVESAFLALEALAPLISWRKHSVGLDNYTDASGEPKGWLCRARYVDQVERPRDEFEMIDPIDFDTMDDRRDDSEDMFKFFPHRRLMISFPGEYVRALEEAPQPSEQHLRATFLAGISMAHEVGHAIFHQDIRLWNPSFLGEPYPGDYCSAELGFAFVAWIFNGYHPQPCDMGGLPLLKFTTPLQWDQRYTTAIGQRPLYKTQYSISMDYIQEKLKQAWWDRIPNEDLRDFSSTAREALKPTTTSEEAATARIPEWYFSWATQRPKWKREFGFKLEGGRPDDTVHGLSEEEIEWQKAQQPAYEPMYLTDSSMDDDSYVNSGVLDPDDGHVRKGC